MDLVVELSERPTGIIGRAQYNTGIFTSAMVSQMMQHFKFLLEALTISSERHISDLPTLRLMNSCTVRVQALSY
jgi:hypothetical protein